MQEPLTRLAPLATLSLKGRGYSSMPPFCRPACFNAEQWRSNCSVAAQSARQYAGPVSRNRRRGMANDKGDSATGGKKRRPATIDLKATEIVPEPVNPSEPAEDIKETPPPEPQAAAPEAASAAPEGAPEPPGAKPP